jgi:hypothetical protein
VREDFVISEDAGIELANLFEVVGFNHEVGDTDDWWSLGGHGGQKDKQNQKGY